MATTSPVQLRHHYLKGLVSIIIILVLLLIGTWISLALDLDRAVGRLFFSPVERWQYQNALPWWLLYHFGTIPGLVLTLGALIVFFIGLAKPRWKDWRKPMLVIVLTSVFGAGLLVNAILKPYCGRPRPREIVEFNGQFEYCRPCLDSQPGKGMSFPCGHCTMGFLFVTLIFCRRQSKCLAYSGAGAGIFFGLLLGLARSIQGAHFLTDVLWSLGAIVLVSLFFNYLIIPLVEKAVSRRKKLTKG